jgi:hypothetical protein
MLEPLPALIDLRDIWLYLSLAASAATLVIWCFMVSEFRRSDDFFARLLSTANYAIFVVIDKVVFYQALMSQPCLDFGFIAAVVAGTVFFYFFAGMLVWFSARALQRGVLTFGSLRVFGPGLFFIAGAQLAAAFAHSSPAGVLLGLTNVIGAIVGRSALYKKFKPPVPPPEVAEAPEEAPALQEEPPVRRRRRRLRWRPQAAELAEGGETVVEGGGQAVEEGAVGGGGQAGEGGEVGRRWRRRRRLPSRPQAAELPEGGETAVERAEPAAEDGGEIRKRWRRRRRRVRVAPVDEDTEAPPQLERPPDPPAEETSATEATMDDQEKAEAQADAGDAIPLTE